MRAILRVDTKSMQTRVEGRFRTDAQMHRSWSRLRGEEGSKEHIALLMGDLLVVADPTIRGNWDQTNFLEVLTISGAMIIQPEAMSETLDTFTVFVPGNLDAFLSRAEVYTHWIVDDLSGPLPQREHVERTGADLPLGKYEATKRREEAKLMLRSILDSDSFENAVNRAREIISQRKDLINDAQKMIMKWNPPQAGQNT